MTQQLFHPGDSPMPTDMLLSFEERRASLASKALLPHGCATTVCLERTGMKLVTENLADAAKFDELARPEQNPELREKLENQASAYRNLAAKRAEELMLLEQLAEFCSVNYCDRRHIPR
jgi:hypothetical protein